MLPIVTEAKPPGNYYIGPGDGIFIKVDEEPDMTLDAKVSAQGTIHFVYLGEITVTGMTVTELKKYLEEKLADGYLRHPRVQVSIKEYRIFFVQGEVKNSGGFAYQPHLTVRKAIVLAGGFTDTANRDHITIIRGTDKTFQEHPVGLDEAIFPGDVVTVKESFW
ncbi:MAG: polysaccharide export protein [Magnetococcus sp. YQC-5]